jgi:xylose isomerase
MLTRLTRRLFSTSGPSVSPLQRAIASKPGDGTPFFPDVEKIKYEGPDSLNPLAFKHYNPEEVIEGKKMKDWMRFSVVYWHTFRGTGSDPFGGGTLHRHWDDGSNSVDNALRRVDAAFEFMSKLGVEYYAFHDRDVAPEGRDLVESNKNLDTIVAKLGEKQKETGIKLLWGTANLFSHPRYACGGGTNPDYNVYAYAAAQVKKAMEVTYKLGGVNYVFWGGREGYSSLLNTNVRKELDNAAHFFRMAVEHKKDLGAKFQLLIEPKPREPMKHQYDYDVQTVMAFLQHYGLQDHYKMNVEPNHTTLAGHDFVHDILVASQYGVLGSVDANTGDELLGWDTDQFLTDVKRATAIMGVIMEQGGLAPGGLNFDAKVRRESTTLADMFIAHISSMDTFARGLRIAAKIRADGHFKRMVAKRYSGFDGVDLSKMSFAKLEAHALKHGEPKPVSGQQELYEMLLNHYV